MSRKETIEAIKKVLVAEQANRSTENRTIKSEGDTTLAWIINERQVVLKAVNEHRQGKAPITEDELVRKAENEALGHFDYTDKYALYAAELALS